MVCSDIFYKGKAAGGRRATGRGAFTMAEFLVALGVCGFVVVQICLLWFCSLRSFAAQMGYVDMDQTSQTALNLLSREIRQVKGLRSFSPQEVVFTDHDDQPLAFTFVNGQLVRTKAGQRTVLLRQCLAGSFRIYQRTPMEGSFEHYPSTTPGTGKLVEVQWLCTRKPPGGFTSCQSVQSAKIVIRSS